MVAYKEDCISWSRKKGPNWGADSKLTEFQSSETFKCSAIAGQVRALAGKIWDPDTQDRRIWVDAPRCRFHGSLNSELAE